MGLIQIQLFLALSGALVGYWIGRSRNIGLAGLLLGLFFGPVGWIIIFAMKKFLPRCPVCGAGIPLRTLRCEVCGFDLKMEGEKNRR